MRSGLSFHVFVIKIWNYFNIKLMLEMFCLLMGLRPRLSVENLSRNRLCCITISLILIQIWIPNSWLPWRIAVSARADILCAFQVCLGGFTITPPAVFRLKAGSGPVHISGQHLVSKYFRQGSCTGGQRRRLHPVSHFS